MLSGIIAVITLVVIVVSKYVTTVHLQRLGRKVAETETELRKARGKLKTTEQTRAAEITDFQADERKKKALERQLDKYKKELAELKK